MKYFQNGSLIIGVRIGGGAMGIETFFRFGLTPFNLLQTLMVKNYSIKQSINQQLCRSYIYKKKLNLHRIDTGVKF